MAIREHAVDHGPDHEPVPNDISFAARVTILAEASARRSELETFPDYEPFFGWNDYILGVCTNLANGDDSELDDSQIEMVLEAWVDFTHMLDIDHHEPFASLDNCFAARP